MNTKLVNRALLIVQKYKEIFKNDKERNEQVHNLAQFYVDRFNDSVRQHEKQVETEIVLGSLDSIKTLHRLQKETGAKEFDNTLMIENCLRLLEDRVDKLRPDVYLKSLESFEDPKLKARFVGSLLKSMREGKFDIRKFYFSQLASLVELVSHYQKQDLHVFFKYVLNCVEQDVFAKQTLKEQFGSFTKLIHLFVKEGFISCQQHSRLYYTYVLTLKEKMEMEGGAKTVSFNDLINIIWLLIATEEDTQFNPLIPRLYERLFEFKRPDRPLSRDELLELY